MKGMKRLGRAARFGRLIQAMDPRGFEVHAVKKETEEEELMHPFMWRFWTKNTREGKNRNL